MADPSEAGGVAPQTGPPEPPTATRLAGRLERIRRRSPLPEGATVIGAALGLQGLTSYAYLVLASRSLGPARYSPLSAVWALIFVAAPGLFLPLEQEVGRALAARRVVGLGGRPVLLRAGFAGAGLVALIVVAALAAAGPLVDRLFDGQGLLFIGFLVAVVCYSGYYLARGLLAGSGAFRAYGALLIVEGLTRVVAAAALSAAGAREAGVFSLAIGLPCVLGLAAVLPRHGHLAGPGPPVAWAETSSALGLLLAASLLAQVLLNIGPLAVKVLATDDPTAAGRFLDGLIIARIPLFFFQAVQASLLPRLAAQAAAGRLAEFRDGLLRILVLLAGVTAATTLTVFAVGPRVVRILFGPGFELGRLDLAILALGSGLLMLALALGQGCIALGAYGRSALGWLAGIAAVVVLLAVLSGTVRRAELGFLGGVVAATVALAVGLGTRLGTGLRRTA